MNALNILVFGLIGALAIALLVLASSAEAVSALSDYSGAYLFAVGMLGLVGAREKNA